MQKWKNYLEKGEVVEKKVFCICQERNFYDCSKSVWELDYTTIDVYPTTLASLGVQIESDRLGLAGGDIIK